MKLNDLANPSNLKLAWRRITTAGNSPYKRLFRKVYLAYEVALDVNLYDLRERILGGAYQPTSPERIYVPKPSGLHRPLTLLTIEDQIVLQAFANLAANKVMHRRIPLQSRVIYSNILEKPDSIFFFRRWQVTYRAFQKRTEEHYSEGMTWVGDFDLAAFYDTISHELLMRTIYPRTKHSDLPWMKRCLQKWSSERAASEHGHGIPQGPLASDFLAECFLLPIDLQLQKNRGYMRYVDDVRLFGVSEDEVRANLIEVERHCRQRGLIPQTGKFAIKKASSVEDAMGMLPSISDPHHTGSALERMSGPQAKAALSLAVGGSPVRVLDKTRLRFVLYRARPDTTILNLVLRLIPHHPEHTDAFFSYLGRFGYRAPVEKLCLELVKNSPYSYVRGEAWHVLARYRRESRSITATSSRELTRRAVQIAKMDAKENLVERWGVCHFLCVCEEVTSIRYSKFLTYQSAMVQALVAPVLPAAAFARDDLVQKYLGRTSPEPGLSVISKLHEMGLSPSSFGLKPDDLPSQVANALRELGCISAPGTRVDPIAEVLQRRYGVPRGKSWHTLLGVEYVHALGLLKQAEAAFDVDRSTWLPVQSAFNQVIYLALQRHLQAVGHPAACTTVDRNGELVNFGSTLNATGPFSRNFPKIGDCFRDMNDRRNHIPLAHPYEKKTAQRSQYLKGQERNKMVAQLRVAYAEFVTLMP